MNAFNISTDRDVGEVAISKRFFKISIAVSPIDSAYLVAVEIMERNVAATQDDKQESMLFSGSDRVNCCSK
jgi:hypothetical protein